jgi:Fic family protein
MLYTTPDLQPHQQTLDTLADLRRRLGAEVARAAPWMGPLRRQARVEAATSSTAIEGFHVAPRAAAQVIDGGLPATSDPEKALAGYALAMAHVTVLADDPFFDWSMRLLLDLHFELCAGAPTAQPGRLREGAMGVTAPGGSVTYRAPDAAALPALLVALVDWLQRDEGPVVVRAAMAHLHLVSIHPFRDGNGRLSRVLQSLVLAREGLLSAEMGSIEAQLARDTGAYYAVLQRVQGGSYQPTRSAQSWVEFVLDAHIVQARERLTTIDQAAARWAVLEALVAARGWPERLQIALEQSLFLGVDRTGYMAEADVSPATASADLRRLADAGLVEQVGRGPETRFVASATLRELTGSESSAVGIRTRR